MSVTVPLGFRAAAATAGIKPSGKPDLALIVRDEVPGTIAGCAMSFTRNQLVGAPIIIGQAARKTALAGGRPVRAVLINAGNSNAATGEQGVQAARTCMAAVAERLWATADEVLPSSTGVIGRPFPVAKVTAAIPTLAEALARGDAADAAAAAAIMTTDLVPKTARAQVELDGVTIRIGAMAKGSGMIAPRLDSATTALPAATMLAFITTDAHIASVDLQAALDQVTDDTFNAISVDNHPSCSDTVVVLSSGQAAGSGAQPIRRGDKRFASFTKVLHELCWNLANQIVTDGEGATRVFDVHVTGAPTVEAARAVAREIVNSPLVKCAIHGRDPNWGRIVTAAGNAGVHFIPDHASLTLGPVRVYNKGVPVVEALIDPRLAEHLAAKRIAVNLELGAGPAAARMVGCDLSAQYVSINADYTT
ncbi:MAG: bifunctional glutamate N-acetyltransferase/amino-acid acetyltransferase ArgJ [Phycisphaerales bacterium]